MKILFVINGLGTGGAERSLDETLAFTGDRVSPVVACLARRDEGIEATALERGLDVRFLDGRGPNLVRAVRRTIRGVRPALVHTTIFEADVAGRLAAAGTGIPVVTSLVNTSYAPERSADPAIAVWKLRMARAIDGWTGRHLTSHFHAITNAVKAASIRDLGLDPKRITVIERGREAERLGRPSSIRRSSARAALAIPNAAPVLVTVGRQEFQKGQWNLIEALAKVRASLPEVQLLVAGRKGNASARLEAALRDTGVDSSVRLLGHRDDVPDVMAAADVFVFPSLYEGLGGALIEAMALGLPIVASDLPAIREVVEPGRNADLVPAGRPADLADAIVALLADPSKRAAYGARGRQIFEERFTLERSAARMMGLFERVAAAGRHGRVEVA